MFQLPSRCFRRVGRAAFAYIVTRSLIEPAPSTLVQNKALCCPTVVRLRVDDLADIEVLAIDLRFDRFIRLGELHHVESDVEKEIVGLGGELWMHCLQVVRIPGFHLRPVLLKELPEAVFHVAAAVLSGCHRWHSHDRRQQAAQQ